MLNRKETGVLIEKLAGNFTTTTIVDVTDGNNRFEMIKHHYENTNIGSFYSFHVNNLPCVDNRLKSTQSITDTLGMPIELLLFLYPDYARLLELGELAFVDYIVQNSDNDS